MDELEEDRRFGRILVDLGLATTEQVESALAEAARRGSAGCPGGCAAVLVERGWVPREAIENARAAAARTQALPVAHDRQLPPPDAPTLSPPAPRAAPAPAPPSSPAAATLLRPSVAAPAPATLPPSAAAGTPFGRYRLLERLGAGGMGVVWRAWDTELQRVVALKQLVNEVAGDAEGRERFLREARLAAKLHHPGIVAVYDVGAVEGKLFLTMDFVAGRTFAAALEPLRAEKRSAGRAGLARLREEVGILAQVAEAVACAHAQGVVHRDLKPQNVLLDAEGHAFVTDFGLAKEVLDERDTPAAARERRSLTASGQVMGTPMYMSPEQVLAETGQIGPAADVWALGVMLYEVLTGETPFERAGKPWDILGAVARQDPVRPRVRSRHVPEELEAVCLKALEKDRARRFGSAAELALDLRRWLQGRPVEARCPSTSYRMWRWTVRRRRTVAGFLVMVAALGVGLWGCWRGRSRVRAEFARARAEVLGLEDALLSEGVTETAIAALARQPLESVNAILREEPGFGPAWSLRGKVYDLIGDRDREAQADLDHGCELAPDSAVVWYLRGMIALRKAEVSRAVPPVAVGGAEVELGPAPPETPEGTRWRERGLADIERMARAAGKDPLLGENEVRLGRALSALLLGGHEGYAAAERWASGIERPEAWRVRGAALYYLKRFDEAVEVLDAATRAWPFDYPSQDLRGLACLAAARVRDARGEDPRPLLQRAIAIFNDTLGKVQFARLVWHRGVAATCLGEAEAARGGDPRAWYRAAIADLEAFDRAEPGQPGVCDARGNAWGDLGASEAARGLDPRPSCARAIADYDEALRRDPDDAVARGNRANAWCLQAEAEAALGLDPRASYARAIADADAALQRNADDAAARINRGNAWLGVGTAEASAGTDARESCRRAIADYGEALRRNARDAKAWSNRGRAWSSLGDAEAARGGDPGASYRKAIADCDEALRLDPNHVAAYGHRGNAWSNLGQAEAARGDDPRASFRKAIADQDAAVLRSPDYAGFADRANAWLRLAAAEAKLGLAPGASYRRAIEDGVRALERNPAGAAACATRGAAWLGLAEAEAAGGSDAAQSYAAAEADARRAIGLHHPNGHLLLGLVCRDLRRYDEAIGAFEALAQAAPQLAVLAREQIGAMGGLRGADAGAGEPWTQEIEAGRRFVAAGDYAAARARYEKGLALLDLGLAALAPAERERRRAEPPVRAAVASAHYDLARILALASAGRAAPGAEARPPAPAEAARLCDDSFDHLRSALDCGWSDRARLEADADLVPLHADPRWAGILARPGR